MVDVVGNVDRKNRVTKVGSKNMVNRCSFSHQVIFVLDHLAQHLEKYMISQVLVVNKIHCFLVAHHTEDLAKGDLPAFEMGQSCDGLLGGVVLAVHNADLKTVNAI